MTKINPDDSVHDEQFDAEENSAEIKTNSGNEPKPDAEKEDKLSEEPGAGFDENTVVAGDGDKAGEPDNEKEHPGSGETTENIESEDTPEETVVPEPQDREDEDDARKDNGAGDNEDNAKEEDKTVELEAEDIPEVDYSGRTKSQLIETLELILENRPLNEIVDDVEKIKIVFYKKHKAELDKKKKSFLEEGGNIEDYDPADDPLELKIKELLAKYRGKKTEYNKHLEIEKQENLKKKYEIIEKIKDLVNREESINKTFQEFRDLQAEWHSIGLVPQSSLRNLWETYNHNVEIFYDYININKELRDLDFKKNMESKIRLCEKAEELILDPNPVNAFRKLQEYHQLWREIGPVPRESRTELWERFRNITSKVNKRHHEYFEKQKEEQKKNLEAKTTLCEKIEEINSLDLKSFTEWEDKAKEVIELQKIWRTLGFAPKKHNNTIYQRFREACDIFFNAKRDFFAQNKEQQLENLQKKTELCLLAESLQDSTDWKEVTDKLIKLQKEWKEIGAVHRKHSDKIWKRFRKACDRFFERKAEHFANLDSSFEDNLKEKEIIIRELELFEPGDDIKDDFEKLKDIQKRWAVIGFVPYKDKDRIMNSYRKALNKQFDRLKIDEEEKAILKYQTKIDNLRETPKAVKKLRGERDKFLGRIKQLENDIVVWENNIGFFSKSSNAESMIQEVQSRIDNARKTIEILEEKIGLIDQSGIDD